MNIIVSVDKNWGIGYKNNLLVKLKEDLKNFKEITTNKVVIMGSKTYNSIPNRPLKNRLNIVLSKNNNFDTMDKNVLVVNSVESAINIVEAANINSDDVYIIGGETIYKLFLPFCKKILLTKIDAEFKSDTYFPNIDTIPNWKKDKESNKIMEKDISYSFIEYINIKK